MAHDFFYAPPSRITGSELVIEGNEFRHLVHVLRRKQGDEIQVVDGAGGEYVAVIGTLTRTAARCSILRRRPGLDESPVPLDLGVGILKNPARFEFLVEKAAELGVRSIVPLQTARTVPQQAKEERWQNLAVAAMKQSGRSILTRIAPLTPLAGFLGSTPAGALRLLAGLNAGTPMLRLLLAQRGRQSIAVCVGPEGGFTDEELSAAADSGFQVVSLGRARLRTETAAIAAAALCAISVSMPPDR